MHTTMRIRSIRSAGLIVMLSIVFQCAWIHPQPKENELIKPSPRGGYTSLRQYIYYPKSLRDAGIEGTVIVNAFVSPEGRVTRTRVTQTLHPELDQIAQNAIERTVFNPATQAGSPLAVWIAIPIQFTLKDWQPESSPFEKFKMIVRPDATYETFAVEFKGRVKPGTELPRHMECLLPLNADQTWVSAGGEKPVSSSTVRDTHGEWLLFDISGQSFSWGFNYRPLPGDSRHKFRYMMMSNQSLPDWTLTVIYSDRETHFSREPDRVSVLQDGETCFEYDLEPLEAFESRYLEIERLNP